MEVAGDLLPSFEVESREIFRRFSVELKETMKRSIEKLQRDIGQIVDEALSPLKVELKQIRKELEEEEQQLDLRVEEESKQTDLKKRSDEFSTSIDGANVAGMTVGRGVVSRVAPILRGPMVFTERGGAASRFVVGPAGSVRMTGGGGFVRGGSGASGSGGGPGVLASGVTNNKGEKRESNSVRGCAMGGRDGHGDGDEVSEKRVRTQRSCHGNVSKKMKIMEVGVRVRQSSGLEKKTVEEQSQILSKGKSVIDQKVGNIDEGSLKGWHVPLICKLQHTTFLFIGLRHVLGPTHKFVNLKSGPIKIVYVRSNTLNFFTPYSYHEETRPTSESFYALTSKSLIQFTCQFLNLTQPLTQYPPTYSASPTFLISNCLLLRPFFSIKHQCSYSISTPWQGTHITLRHLKIIAHGQCWSWTNTNTGNTCYRCQDIANCHPP